MVWIPTTDPAMLMGPFLQVPRYLPSSQAIHGQCMPWYPGSAGKELNSAQYMLARSQNQMSPNAPSFVPASQKVSSAPSKPQGSPNALSIAAPRGLGDNAPGNASPSRGSRAVVEKSDAPSATASTPSVSCCNSVLEEDAHTSRSPRSEVTSAETLAADVASQRGQEEEERRLALSATTASDANEVPLWQEQEVDLLRAELEAERLLREELEAQLRAQTVDHVPSPTNQASSGGVPIALQTPPRKCRGAEADVVRVTARTVEQETTPSRSKWTPSLRLPAESPSDGHFAQSQPSESQHVGVAYGLIQPVLAKSGEDANTHLAERSGDADLCCIEDSDNTLHIEDELVIDPEAADPEISDRCHEYSPEEEYVIDPEAADPSEGTEAKSKGMGATKAEPKPFEKARSRDGQDSRSSVRGKQTLESTPGDEHPSLDLVIGAWWDSRDSYYEVNYDRGSTSSCSVVTTRPDGGKITTCNLIHQRPFKFRGKKIQPGTILWSNAYTLMTPLESADTLCWKSLIGGKDFTWTRDTEKDTDRSKVQRQAVKQGRRGAVTEETRHTSSRQRPGSTGRVWRAVEKKAEKKEDSKSAAPIVEEWPCLWKRAKGGQWRMIRK